MKGTWETRSLAAAPSLSGCVALTSLYFIYKMKLLKQCLSPLKLPNFLVARDEICYILPPANGNKMNIVCLGYWNLYGNNQGLILLFKKVTQHFT